MASTKPPKKTFPITTFISDLPTKHVFGPDLGSDQHGHPNGRLVIIGDVHGMRKSLEALLEKVGFDESRDHLILAGDLVNKGPDSAGVVDIAIKLGASAVRGNHDNAVLNAAADIKVNRDVLLKFARSDEKAEELKCSQPGTDKPHEEEPTQCPCAKAGIEAAHSASTHSTAEQLSSHHLEWLAALPLILRVNLPEHLESPFGGSLTVVHAGLVPDVSLDNQDPHTIMHMRSLVHTSENDPKFAPAEGAGDESWVKEWDQWQGQLSSRTTVVFGHDAKRRIQLGKYAIGLDSGCLYGNQLSAMVISSTGTELNYRIVQVECADTPVAPKG